VHHIEAHGLIKLNIKKEFIKFLIAYSFFHL